jgi:MFS family permease
MENDENNIKHEANNEDITVSNPRVLKKVPSGTVTLGRTKRCWVFAFIVVVNIFINMDHGYFPAATEEFKNEYHLNASLLGLFGSAVYFGNLCGSVMVVSLIDRFNRKYQFIFFLFLNSVALYAFTLYRNTYYGIFNRVVVGFTQV